MRLMQVLAILGDAVVNESPVMVHFGFDPDNIIVISGPKEPIIRAEVAFDDLVCAVTKSNMQFFIDPADIRMIQVADVTDPRFEKKQPPTQTGMYN
jgi:hypothetical protein